MKPSKKPSYAERVHSLVQALYRYLPNLHNDDVWPKFREALVQYGAEMRSAVGNDREAKEALFVLESKARERAEQKGTQPPRNLLGDILALWPWGYQTPPARLRRAEIAQLRRRAVSTRGLAEIVAKDLRWRSPNSEYYAPRSWKGAQIQMPVDPILASYSELEPLPELLELYASLLSMKADSLRDCAKQEPTKKKWLTDVEARILEYVKRQTGQPYRAKVSAILRAMSPSLYKPTFADVGETLRKREYRRRKSPST